MSRDVFTFGNRTAVVTGGSKNIGFAITERLLRAGMQVAIVSSNSQHQRVSLDHLNKLGFAPTAWLCDVSEVAALPPILDSIYQQHGSIDVLVNCAGILDLSEVEDVTEEMWNNVLDVNLKGTFFMTQQCVPYLKSGTSPRIINISSNAGRMGGYANAMSYTASKGGVISLTYGLARRLAPFGITVNCVAPGTIESDMSRMRDDNSHKKLLEQIPLSRLGTADEVASAVCYFASCESGFSTGAVLDVNGGMFIG